MITDDDKAAATRAIFHYMTDRNAWERDAWKLGRKRGSDEVMYQNHLLVQAGYEALMRRHCAPRVIDLNLRSALRHPPSVDPEGTRIVSIKRARGAIKVLTDEQQPGGFPNDTYEYELIDVDGVLKLSERRYRPPTGRPIREVW